MMSTRPKPMTAPEPMPKSAANVIMAALLRPGIQSARIMIIEKSTMIVITLNRPYLSASTLGTVLPMKLLANLESVLPLRFRKAKGVKESRFAYLAPLRIGIRLMAMVVDIP